MPDAEFPIRSREYRNHHLDSRRWDAIPLRDDDIVISTSYKAGTTWTQRIVSLLLFGPGALPGTLNTLSPWVDARFHAPLELLKSHLEAQTHRRFMKSHLPLDGLPWDERVRYVVVGRDGRDVFMSLWNHYQNYTDEIYERLNGGEDLHGDPFPRWRDDLHGLFADWITRGWFPWEQDGYPFWSHLHHAQSFWRHRGQPNLHFVHFADLKADLEGEMRRLAAFLGIEVDPADWPARIEAARFTAMKRDADVLLPELALGFKGGPQAFIHKGTNERWRGVLRDDELAAYDRAVARALEPACSAWLAQGRSGSDPKTA